MKIQAPTKKQALQFYEVSFPFLLNPTHTDTHTLTHTHPKTRQRLWRVGSVKLPPSQPEEHSAWSPIWAGPSVTPGKPWGLLWMNRGHCPSQGAVLVVLSDVARDITLQCQSAGQCWWTSRSDAAPGPEASLSLHATHVKSALCFPQARGERGAGHLEGWLWPRMKSPLPLYPPSSWQVAWRNLLHVSHLVEAEGNNCVKFYLLRADIGWVHEGCFERWKTGGEGDDRGQDGWTASPTLWTWVWASSGSCWWIGKPGVLQSMGSQGARHDWATEQQQMKDMHMLGGGVEQSLPWGCRWSDGLEPQDQKKPLPPLLLRLDPCLTCPSCEVPVGRWGSQLSCKCVRGSLPH